MKRISKKQAIKEIEAARDRECGRLDELEKGRDNPVTNEVYWRTCGKAEAYIDVIDVLKLNSLVTIRC